jgi:hypothetical protein
MAQGEGTITNMQDPEGLTVPYESVPADHSALSPLVAFLSYLVFEGHGTRVGLELSLCVVSYTATTAFVPWQSLGVPPRWSSLVAWFGCCLTVLLFDQLFLCRSAHALRKSYLLNLGGAYEQALQLLEQIGPRSRSLIKLPIAVYHLHRAEVFAQAKDFSRAEWELVQAEQKAAYSVKIAIMRSQVLRMRGEYGAAEQELESAAKTFGSTPVLRFEQALLSFDKGENPWEAKRAFQDVMDMPETPHFLGDTTYQLARAYWSACRLKTGEAEEGIEELSWSIERLRSAISYVDTLRPVLARLMLERSAYYASHKEPAQAAMDVRTALIFCTYPAITNKAELIRDELAWRYKMPLVW